MSTSPQTVSEHSLILEKHEDGVATLTLNRPDKLNA
jgi:enoyl-CoA hydratase/carnithine racemase